MELKRYFTLLVRWIWLIVLAVVVGGGTAYLISRSTPATYRATTTLFVNQSSRTASSTEYSNLLANERLAKTYSELLKSPAVLKSTALRLGGVMNSRTYVDADVDVELVRDTQLIQLSVTSRNPALAVSIAQTIPVVFTEQNAQLQSGRYTTSMQSLKQEMDSVQRDIDQTQSMLGALSSTDSSPERGRLEANLAQYRATYADLLKSYENIRVAEAQEANSLTVVNPPEVPTEPVGPRTTTNTLLAAFLSAGLALTVAGLTEYLDDRIKSPEDLAASKLPTLGSISMIQGKSESEKMIVLRSPRSAISEAYRVLRTNLEYAAVANNDMRRLLVTSAGAGEGKSTTAANLAASLAQAGKRVVLVDADLRRPTQHQIFSISNSQGLTTALLNTTGRPIEEFLQPTSLDTLRVLPSGPMPPNPAEILGSAAMSQILDDLSRVADIVIFDSPPVLGVADSAIMAPMVDGVLLVLHWGATRRDGLMRAKEVLAPVGTPILGLVLNRMTNDSRGYYYYTYYRSHYYTGENPKRAHRLAGLLQVIRR